MHARQDDETLEETSGSESENSSTDETPLNKSRSKSSGIDDSNSKKRKRPQKISCELCKARKVKCDRQEPACGWCARNNRLCVYNERKRPGLRQSYGVDVEDKFQRIETMIGRLSHQLEDHINASSICTQPSASNPAGNDHIRLAQPQTYSPERSNAVQFQSTRNGYSNDHNSLHPTWQMQSGSAIEDSPYSGPGSKNATNDSAYANRRHSRSDSFSNSYLNTRFEFDILQNGDLPPTEALYDLIDLYFKHVNTWSPILERKATFAVLSRAQGPTEEDRILLHAIVAVALRFSKDPRYTTELRRRYYNTSKQMVLIYALEHPSIKAMQALALVTIDAHGTSNGVNSWNLLALLGRNMIQLGLGVERSVYLQTPPQPLGPGYSHNFALPQPKSWIEDEGRRRLFWMTYVIDRYATISDHLDFTLDDKELDRPLPCRYDLFSNSQAVETRWFKGPDTSEAIIDHPDNLGSFSYHCEVLRILSQIHRFLRKPMDIDSLEDVTWWRDTYRGLDMELSTWLTRLPGGYGNISQLCHSDPGSRVSNWIMIHAAFVTAVIRLHSVAAYPTSHSGIFQPSFNAVRKCLGAVESLRGIAQDVVDGGMLGLLGPPFAFSLWTSGRLLLVHATTSGRSGVNPSNLAGASSPAPTMNTVDATIWFFISTLRSMGQYWKIARSWSDMLSRLVREVQPPNPPPPPPPPPSTHLSLSSPPPPAITVSTSSSSSSSPAGKTKSYASMRKIACQLAGQASRKPRSVLDPSSTRELTTNEMEYLAVFDWFDHPRLPAGHRCLFSSSSDHATSTSREGSSSPATIMNEETRSEDVRFAAPDPENDWLNIRQPYDFQPPCE